MGFSQRGTRETAKRFSRPVAQREGGFRSPLRHAFGMTPPPKGEARLGSPFGGAGAVRRLRGQLAAAPPRTCAILSMSTSEASCHGRELPGVQPPRIDSGGTPPRLARGAIPAHVRYSLDEHERSELPWARIDSGGTPPRLARGATPQALGLQSLPDVWYAKQNPREECLL